MIACMHDLNDCALSLLCKVGLEVVHSFVSSSRALCRFRFNASAVLDSWQDWYTPSERAAAVNVDTRVHGRKT